MKQPVDDIAFAIAFKNPSDIFNNRRDGSYRKRTEFDEKFSNIREVSLTISNQRYAGLN